MFEVAVTHLVAFIAGAFATALIFVVFGIRLGHIDHPRRQDPF